MTAKQFFTARNKRFSYDRPAASCRSRQRHAMGLLQSVSVLYYHIRFLIIFQTGPAETLEYLHSLGAGNDHRYDVFYYSLLSHSFSAPTI